MSSANAIFSKIIENIISPVVEFVVALSVLLFMWGVFQFVFNSEDASKRETGRNHMIWGIVGFFIMVSVLGIIRFVASSIGVSSPV